MHIVIHVNFINRCRGVCVCVCVCANIKSYVIIDYNLK
jgi:hypothetical protein